MMEEEYVLCLAFVLWCKDCLGPAMTDC